MLYEIEVDGRFYYVSGSDEFDAEARAKNMFGGRWSRVFFTGRVKTSGKADA